MTEWRDWSKIVRMIESNEQKEEITEYILSAKCIFCYNLKIPINVMFYGTVPDVVCGFLCPLSCSWNSYLKKECAGGHYQVVLDWLHSENNVTKNQALESAKLISEIQKYSVG